MAAQCPTCGGTLKKIAGNAAQCGTCKKQFRLRTQPAMVPPDTEPLAGSYDLTADIQASSQQSDSTAPQKVCPSCSETVPDSAVLCTMCGYNFKNKTKFTAQVTSKSQKPIKSTIFQKGHSTYGRSKIPANASTPRYFGIQFIASILVIIGAVTIVWGGIVIAISIFTDKSPNAIGVGWVVGTIQIIVGVIIIGIGQLYAAFRDMAINSFLIANK